MTDLGSSTSTQLPRKTFRFRGVDRVVGTVKQPSELDLAELAVKGFFHRLLGIRDAVAQQGPPPPDAVDNWTKAEAALSTMLLNDKLGDCVCAADLHLASMRAANAGVLWTPIDSQALSLYETVAGYDPTNPATDAGTDPMALVRYRLGNAYPDGATLRDARLVDTCNVVAVKQALWLATGCLAWASLPDAWESEEGDGDVWDVAGDPNPNNGHCIGLVCYDDHILVSTWGEQVKLTFAAAAKYLTQSAGGGCLALVDSRCANQTIITALDAEAAAK